MQDRSDPSSLLSERLTALPTEFQSFARVYERDIRPTLLAEEGRRVAAAAKSRQFMFYAIAVGVIGAVLALLILKSPLGLILAALPAGGLWYYGRRDIERLSGEAKSMMVRPVANQFGLDYSETAFMESDNTLREMRSLGVIPGWDRQKLEDGLTGERKACDFEFFEAHLEDKRTRTDSKGRRRTEWVTVFKGQIWRMDAPKQFHGTTKVTRDSGIFNALGAIGSKFSRVKLEDPEFEKRFEVYGTDQVEARFILTPDVMQSLLDLETTFKGARLRCAFDQNRIYIAAEGGNLLEPGSMNKPLDDPERIGRILEEFASVFHLIDVLAQH